MNQPRLHIVGRGLLAGIVVVAVGASTTLAQTRRIDAAMAPGQRVRVTAASSSFTGVLVGNVVKVGAESLSLVSTQRAEP